MQKEKRAAARERNQDWFHVEGEASCAHTGRVLQHPGIQEEQQDGAEEVWQLGATEDMM